MDQEPTDAEKKEAVLKRITTELAGAGFNVTRSGDDITVHEETAGSRALPSRAQGASTARNLGMLLVAAILLPIGVYLAAAIWFAVALAAIGQLGGTSPDAHGIGESAAAIAAMLAAATAGAGAIVAGASARTRTGERDPAAFLPGLVIGAVLCAFAVTRLGPGLDALLSGHELGGLAAAGLFLLLAGWIGDRFFSGRRGA